MLFRSSLCGAYTSVFPNPFNDAIHLEVDPRLVGKDFIVYDQIGKVVISERIGSVHNSIDLSNLSSGIYFLRAGTENAFKLIKE